MRTSAVVSEMLSRSGLSQSALSARSGVSRSLVNAYLKGERQPSVAQLDRLAHAAGLVLDVSLSSPRAVPDSFVAVLEFGDLFPRRERAPLLDIGPVWATARAPRTDVDPPRA